MTRPNVEGSPMNRVAAPVKWILPMAFVALAACSKSPSGDEAPAAGEATSAMAPQPAPASSPSPEAMTASGTAEPIATFTARGNEPFWSVQVEGSTLTYRTPELQPGKVLQSVRQDHAQGVHFTGKDGGKDFSLDISSVPCTDSMSGESFEFTAMFAHEGKSVTGCAKRGL